MNKETQKVNANNVINKVKASFSSLVAKIKDAFTMPSTEIVFA